MFNYILITGLVVQLGCEGTSLIVSTLLVILGTVTHLNKFAERMDRFLWQLYPSVHTNQGRYSITCIQTGICFCMLCSFPIRHQHDKG